MTSPTNFTLQFESSIGFEPKINDFADHFHATWIILDIYKVEGRRIQLLIVFKAIAGFQIQFLVHSDTLYIFIDLRIGVEPISVNP
jgi:hypothetical protein